MLRVLWHRTVVIVVGSQPEIDLFEIGLADVDLVERTDDRAILETDTEGLRIHLQPRHVGADKLPERVEIAGSSQGAAGGKSSTGNRQVLSRPDSKDPRPCAAYP